MDEKQILDLYWNRSEEAIRETQDKYYGYIYSIISGILSNKEDAEECFDDSLLKMWNSIPPNRPSNLRLYLGKIARNTAIDRLRYSSVKKRDAVTISLSELDDMGANYKDVDKNIDKLALVQIINSFLAEQKRLYRIVFIQKYWYFLSVNQISEINNISTSKALSILYRLKKKLKEKLIKEGYII